MALNTLAKGPARTRHRAGSRNWLDAETRAQGLEDTGLAPGFSGLAGSPAVQDEPVADSDPFLLGNDLHQVLLYLKGVLSTREPQPMGESIDVSIDDHTGRLAETVSQNHVGCLSRHAGKSEQLLHVLWHAASEVLDDLLTGALNRLGFVAKETRRPDEPLELAPVGTGQIGSLREASEQGRRHLVDPLVGALGGENGSHQELYWSSVTERRARLGKGLAQLSHDQAGPPLPLLLGFASHELTLA